VVEVNLTDSGTRLAQLVKLNSLRQTIKDSGSKRLQICYLPPIANAASDFGFLTLGIRHRILNSGSTVVLAPPTQALTKLRQLDYSMVRTV